MTSAPPSNDDHRDSAARLHLTVASVIEREGRFLMVEEQTRQGRRFNQPAGHLEPGESLLEGARRELLEETAWEAELVGLVGLGLYASPDNGITYCRTTFYGHPLRHHPDRLLDEGILAAHWLTLGEIRQLSAKLRSPLVLQALEHYLNGHRYSLDLLY